MRYLLATISNGIRITAGFDSLELAERAQKRALANGATFAAIL